jgi:hypothetical protein
MQTPQAHLAPTQVFKHQLETLMRFRNCVRKRLQQWPNLFCNGDLDSYRPFKLLSRSITSLELRTSLFAGNKKLGSTPQSAQASPPTSPSASLSVLTLALTHYTRFYQVAGTRYSGWTVSHNGNIQDLVKKCQKRALQHVFGVSQEALVKANPYSALRSYPWPSTAQEVRSLRSQHALNQPNHQKPGPFH